MGNIKPELPPRIGYIESRDFENRPIYIPTPETVEKIESEVMVSSLQKENLLLKTQLQFQAEHAAMLEGCIVELAAMVYPDA